MAMHLRLDEFGGGMELQENWEENKGVVRVSEYCEYKLNAEIQQI